MEFEQVKELVNDFIKNRWGVYLKNEHYHDCYSINGFTYNTAIEKKNDMKKTGKFKNLSVKKNGYGFGIIYFNVK